jgi:hypothetical protein
MKQDSGIYNLLRYIAIAGNIIFVLWILLNGINEGFKGTFLEIISYVGLMILLLIIAILLYSHQSKT